MPLIDIKFYPLLVFRAESEPYSPASTPNMVNIERFSLLRTLLGLMVNNYPCNFASCVLAPWELSLSMSWMGLQ